MSHIINDVYVVGLFDASPDELLCSIVKSVAKVAKDVQFRRVHDQAIAAK